MRYNKLNNIFINMVIIVCGIKSNHSSPFISFSNIFNHDSSFSPNKCHYDMPYTYTPKKNKNLLQKIFDN